ncbi:MAG: LPS-assembly protein LptD [Alphaproteobacteria bacterium]|nr:LPS-assembly protein LptD [Alphaproteobacteria bacterium]
MDLQADTMSHDEQSGLITASGDVMVVQDGRILRADTMDYNLGTDTVHAEGYVVLNEESGDIHLSDEVTYNDKLKNGTVRNLSSVLNDGSRFTAKSGEREKGVKTTMHTASYTPCEPCQNDPEAPPIWGLRAAEVVHDQEEHRISYKHARLEVKGVPVAYTPYFSHPDGTVKQKSGFLSPSAGYKSELGAFVEGRYYWAIAPDQDTTFGLRTMTEQAPLGTMEYRKRWENAGVKIAGGLTSSDHTDSSAGQSVKKGEEVRGHVFVEGLWDMNDKWRSGLEAKWSSDDQYMRQYDFASEDVLVSRLYTERFSGRDYATAALVSFQDTRIRDAALDQPDILPEIYANFKGEPGAIPVIKGQWDIKTSALGLQREGDEQDMRRFSLGGGWKRRLVSDYGLVTTAEARVRGDVYNSTDRLVATPGSGRSKSVSAARAFPQAEIKTSYPMARAYENMQARIEPIISLTAAPNISNNDKIPNEDSNDVQIDASNLFEANRFPGYDRVEDQSRVTYGVRSGLFGYGGSYGEAFIGQSYRFSEDDNPFPRGSGLNLQHSDVVGQLSGRYKNLYTLDYRFQLAGDDLTSARHEIDAGLDFNRFRLNTRYLFAKALSGTDIDESREQLQGAAQFYVNKEWRLRSGATQDLGADPGLRKFYGGIDYLGQCLFLSLTGEKNFTSDVSGDSGTEILFRIGLKNLGEFEESSLRPAIDAGR